MDESDEDIDPRVGPVADLMAEHNLSSKAIDVKNPVESMMILEQKINIRDYLSFLNIHLLFKNVCNSILDRQWYYYLNKYSPKLEQEIFFFNQSSLKNLSLLFIVGISLSSTSSDLFLIFSRSTQFLLHHFHSSSIFYLFFTSPIFSSLIFFFQF